MEWPQNIEGLRANPDADESIVSMAQEAVEYINSFKWVHNVERGIVEFSTEGIIIVIRFHITPATNDIDDEIWVVAGNMPPAYFVTDCANSADKAMEVYCQLMEDWSNAVLKDEELTEFFPVLAPATHQNARDLLKRMKFIRKHIIPNWQDIG